MSGPELHRGKLARHPRILSVEPLEREDLACLREKRVGPPRIKALRRSHHRVARLIALGYKDAQITQMTGYTATRIGQLKVDPAVQELIATYDKKVEEDFERKIDHVHEEMCEVKLRGLNLIQERLDQAEDEDNPTPIALKDLMTLVGDMADRTGHGKHSSQTKEVVNFAEMMKQLARSSGRSNVIDATATDITPTSRLEESSDDLSNPVANGFLRRA